ncbi:MAG TPA: beta-propeller fold lactonase family protein [Polyangia bacterium]
MQRSQSARASWCLIATMVVACGGGVRMSGDPAPAPVAGEALHVFVGSHTRPEIAHLHLDSALGNLIVKDRIATAPFPRALAWNQKADVLYAANDRSFQLSAFRLDRTPGVLSPLGAVRDGEFANGDLAWPLNLALHPSGNWLLVGRHIDDGNSGIGVHQLDDTGRWTGRSVNAPLACDDNANFNAAFDPSGRFAYGACDNEGLFRFLFEEASGALTHQRLEGLEHVDSTDLLFVRGIPAAYLFNDTSSSATVLTHSPDTGGLVFDDGNSVSFRAEAPTPPVPLDDPVVGRMTLDPAGTFVYFSLPSQNAIGVDKVGAPGSRRMGRKIIGQGAELRRPTHAIRSPVGPWLLVANAETGTVAVFKTFAQASGDLGIDLVGAPVHAVDGASFIAIASPAAP